MTRPWRDQMRNFNIADGDRGDAVANALRRLWLRTECCPCGGGGCQQCTVDHANSCRQCTLDHAAIAAAWKATEPTDLPGKVDLRDKMPPVRDQGGLNAGTSFAVAATWAAKVVRDAGGDNAEYHAEALERAARKREEPIGSPAGGMRGEICHICGLTRKACLGRNQEGVR